MEFTLSYDRVQRMIGANPVPFPKYVTQILNLANQNAQATRPKVVGQVSELIKEFPGNTLVEWEQWYLERHPHAIEEATKKISSMLQKLDVAIDAIDEEMIRRWVKDLVIVKTFIGLKFQKAVLEYLAEKFDVEYRIATPEEESKGIDGFLGDLPISIKPTSYASKKMLREEIDVPVVYYEKRAKGLRITVPDDLFPLRR